MPVSELTSSTSLLLLEPLLEALGGREQVVAHPYGGLPAPVLQMLDLPVLLSATALTAPGTFRPRLVAAAHARDLDVLLVRHGLHPETLDMVAYDVVLNRWPHIHRLWSRCLFRHRDGGLWLVPPHPGSTDEGHVEVTRAGLRWTTHAPFADADERSDGVCRAARATVLALRARRRP